MTKIPHYYLFPITWLKSYLIQVEILLTIENIDQKFTTLIYYFSMCVPKFNIPDYFERIRFKYLKRKRQVSELLVDSTDDLSLQKF